ncbi:MarR family transcriptional regulator [Faecalicatena sp. Marseille-Q4148]|nr:MarR family transcriptional regulator [Faecalicatena sp. Marseille-Q4148]
MKRTTDLLVSIRKILKIDEDLMKSVCEMYDLTLIEAKILVFLKNNPGCDTAADIVEYRMLSKGNVSQAVDSLIRKQYLQRRPDENDRRKVHLSLLPAADPVSAKMQILRSDYEKRLFDGMTEEERQTFIRLSNKVIENSKKIAERRK